MTIKKLLKIDLQGLVMLGIVIAMKIILGRFSFGPAIVKVGLGFIGSVMLGYLFGPIWGAVGGCISDLVSSALFGNQGGFFIGFTLTAMAGPFIYGLFFYQKPVKMANYRGYLISYSDCKYWYEYVMGALSLWHEP